MTAKIIDGKAFAAKLQNTVKAGVAARLANHLSAPGLAVVLVGNDPASAVYVRNKQRACEAIGIISQRFDLPEETNQTTLLQLVNQFNQNPAIHGILVQLPLPSQIDVATIIAAIDPKKDVDGFHPTVLDKMARGETVLRPCTPYGVIQMLHDLNIPLQGRHAVVVGDSIIVGKPLAIELRLAGCEVTVCNKYTQDLATEVKKGDIVAVAVGKPNLIPGSWIKEGAVVIDIGTTRLANGKLSGDVNFAEAQQRASYITPVPGGVGPVTIATLMRNTLQAANQLDNFQ
ncbi:MAG: bifunctional methylenetetrahydrofolate dehydrogenase/methenyltetrahydrofolate cyclohydrolase FolD [Gammaproteobacteria bacterium]|nr:bifunctional methylenetetrahydrofolate dehydrogenase/methenyltetrahydrofolate cyclohydrolase FolD [Gammaproteobacteria bacterium]